MRCARKPLSTAPALAQVAPGSSRTTRQSRQSPERSEGINPLAWSLSYRQLQIARLHVREEVRFSDGSRLFFHFRPGIATWSACCSVDPLTPGDSGGSERASPPARRPFHFPHGSSRWLAGVRRPYPFPPRSLPSGQRFASYASIASTIVLSSAPNLAPKSAGV